MPRPLQRMPLELGLQLNINQLLRDGFIEPGQITPFKDCHWLDDDGDLKANARICTDMTKGSTVANSACYGTMHIVADWIHQIIELVPCPRHFGGRQWYFVCPRQGRCVSVLWSPPSARFFAGRKSWGDRVAYLSQYYGPGSRAHYMARKLCECIGGPGASDEWDVPPKPKGMRWRTYERLSNRCEKYYDQAAVLPREYRLAGDVV
jgi:hypothetical protein